MAQEDRVAVEARWTGVLAVTVGTLAAGVEMKASFAMFFRFRDGRIAMQRNYDCFEAWQQKDSSIPNSESPQPETVFWLALIRRQGCQARPLNILNKREDDLDDLVSR